LVSLILPVVLLAGIVTLPVSARADMTTVFSTDFESGLPTELSGAGNIEGTWGYSSFGFGNSFLRNTTSGATVLTLTGLPSHDSLTLAFDLAIIDSWDGTTSSFGGANAVDTFTVSVDGATKFSATFDNFVQCDQSAPTSNTITFGTQLGFTGVTSNAHVYRCDGTLISGSIDYWDSAYDFSKPVVGLTGLPHNASDVTISFSAGGSGWQGGTDESWAIDNVRVSVASTLVPEPSERGMIFCGLLVGMVLVLFRRRRARGNT
jgi:hypothetical protein